MAQANVKAVITADDRASSVLAGVGNSFSKLLKLTAVGVAAAGAGAVAFGVSAVKSFQESENAAAQLNAVLKSTGGIAGVTADQANDLASSLQRVTKFSDEAILGGENLLLTFTNIGKDVFPQATETMLDMSQALGQDVKASAVQLGKALQDPILGVTALRRVGVNFSDKQRDVIKSLVDTGRSAEAQKLILKELQTEFGGSARAAGDTFAGKMEILKNSFDDVKESVGKTIVDALAPLAAKLSEFVASDQFQAWLKQLNEWLAVNIPIAIAWLRDEGIPLLVETFKTMLPILKALFDAFVAVIGFLNDNRWVLYAIVAGFVAIKTAMFLQGALQAFQGVMVGVKVAYLGMRALVTAPMFLPAIGVAAALASLAMVYAAIQSIKTAINDVNNAAKAAENLAPEAKMRELQAQAARQRAAGDTAGAARTAAALRALGGNALGGNVQAGVPRIVGEQGKEMFVPNQNGTIVPNHDLQGGGQISINVNVGMYAGSEMEKRKVAEALFEALKDAAGARNTTVGKMMGV